MKKRHSIILLSLSFLLGINFANATIVIIQATGTNDATNAFLPAIATATCGDTIKWVLVSGAHTTASTTIPNGAAPWTSPGITAFGFSYVATVAGTYNYTCHPSSGGHMSASFVVTCATGIVSIDHDYHISAYPNPFDNKITIEVTNADMITLYNVVGEKIKSVALQGGQTKVEVDATELPQGCYFYCIIKEGVVVATKRIVKK